MDKMIEEHIATIEIKKELCDKPCDLCKMYGKECMPLRMAKKLAKQRWRKQEQGEWKPVMQELNYYDTCKCSVCDFEIDISLTDYKYCPNCFAKMKGN